MIEYRNTLDGVKASQLAGFFVGWPNPPQPATHLRMLQGASALTLAVDDTTGQVVGFAYAVSDGVLTAFIPLLEVLPDYQRQGIGSELIQKLVTQLDHLYSIDLMCDPEIQPFYARLGWRAGTGMMLRHYARQNGMGR